MLPHTCGLHTHVFVSKSQLTTRAKPPLSAKNITHHCSCCQLRPLHRFHAIVRQSRRRIAALARVCCRREHLGATQCPAAFCCLELLVALDSLADRHWTGNVLAVCATATSLALALAAAPACNVLGVTCVVRVGLDSCEGVWWVFWVQGPGMCV